MPITDFILKIIGSKWFILLIGVAMCFGLPYTWVGMRTGYHPWAIAVFLMNVVGPMFCFYKFTSMTWGKDKANQVQAPEEW